MNEQQTNNLGKSIVQIFDDFYLFNCPHCNIEIVVIKNELNCRIFRCGEYLKNGEPIPPHAPKIMCDKLKADNLINGCGKPFIFKENVVETCDYI